MCWLARARHGHGQGGSRTLGWKPAGVGQGAAGLDLCGKLLRGPPTAHGEKRRMACPSRQHTHRVVTNSTNVSRSVLRPSSPTRLSASVSVSSSSRTARRSPPSSPTTAASTSPTRTTRSSSLVSVAAERPRVISPVSASRSSRSRASASSLSGRRRRRSPVRKRTGVSLLLPFIALGDALYD